MVNRLMTEDEKISITRQSIALRNEGKHEEARALEKTMPMPPFLAKFAKDHGLSNFLIESKWNMAEAEAVFGTDWLAH